MFARKIHIEVLAPGAPRECPVAWLDSFCMRNFTGRSVFDDLLPVADGLMEAGFRVDLEFLKRDLEGWLTRKFGGGSQVVVRFTEKSEEFAQKSAG